MSLSAPILALVPTSAVTHQAVADGSWFDPNTWADGQIPPTGARVLIPEGIEVIYDGASDARIFTLRVDGKLGFAPDQNTRILVDTFVVTETGTLEIGTETNPVAADKQTEIIFAPVDPTQRGIDVNWDPRQLSRGLLTEYGAQVSVVGAEKTPYLTLAGNALAGDTELVFSQPIPDDWQVGDRIVLTGTRWNAKGSHADNSVTQDEVLTITAIDGNRIEFSHNDAAGNSLRFHHKAPAGYDLEIYAANLSRNVRFESEAGANAPIPERGHTLNQGNVTLKNAAWIGLGRTDKDKIINDPQFDAAGNLIPGTGTNARWRAPIHIDEVLIINPDDPGSTIIQGNAVWTSPGWGYTIHSSRAVVEDNVSFDVLGAHYVTEVGDEQAIFRRNIAIKSPGAKTDPNATLINPTDPRGLIRDFASSGLGFWFQSSYSVFAFEDNISTGTADAGVIVYGRTDSLKPPAVPTSSLPDELRIIAGGAAMIDSWKVPVRNFNDNTIYNADSGVEIRGVMRDDSSFDIFGVRHDIPSSLVNTTIWGVRSNGVQTAYSSKVLIKDAVVLGNLNNPIPRRPNGIGKGAGGEIDTIGVGLFADKNARDVVYDNVQVEGFYAGVTVPQTGPFQITREFPFGVGSLVGGSFANNTFNLFPAPGRRADVYLPPLQQDVVTFPFTPYFIITGEPEFEIPEGEEAPVAQFTTKAIGGLAQLFDASQSYDPDYGLNYVESPNTPFTVGDNTIAGFAWDFDNDGQMDKYGRYATYVFPEAGAYPVTLKVTDHQGQVVSLTQTVEVDAIPYSNRIVDGGFTVPLGLQPSFGRTTWFTDKALDEPPDLQPSFGRVNWYEFGFWIASSSSKWNHDPSSQRFFADNTGNSGLAQIIFDDSTTRGIQSVSFDAVNLGSNNTLRFQLYGVKGFFSFLLGSPSSPANFSNTLPLETTTLLDTGNLATSSFDWTTFRWDSVDFGSGYDFLALRFLTNGVGDGETQLLDNIYIGSGSTVLTPEFAITANHASKTEGYSGTKNFTFTVTRSVTTEGTDTLDWAVTGSGLTPADGADFAGGILPSGSITFNPGETERVITVQIQGDANLEPNETFTVALSNPSSGVITVPGASSTITNDDVATVLTPEFAITANHASKTEGDSGAKNFTFTVTRSVTTEGTETLDWAVTGSGLTPADGADFAGGILPSGSITFNPGETERVITVQIQGDADLEPNETFTVALSNPSSGVITVPGASSTITNDDVPIDENPNASILGTPGNDLLNGTPGADILEGLAGNDIYLVNNPGDAVIEQPNEGNDGIRASVSYTMPANVEVLFLLGSDNLNATGNNSADRLTGNSGNNVLQGLGGNDILNGNAGADILIGGLGNDILTLGNNDGALDLAVYSLGDGFDRVEGFEPGIDQLSFTGIEFIDVVPLGNDAELRLGNGIAGDSDFGQGERIMLLFNVALTAAEVGVDGSSLAPTNSAAFFFS
ncbi:MAG: RTX toxin [Cyanobacteria bacterium RI_101]|nr:RTX toxin [Cyanobacteria bacterium RI_101]